MAIFLAKTEPNDFSYADLEAVRREPWDGVSNPAAQKAMRSMAKGDEVFIYHTGKERRIAGLARVVKGAYPDPDHPGALASGEPKRVLVDVAPVKAATRDLTLADIKGDSAFAGFALVKQSRQSVMEVPKGLAARIKKGAGL